MSSPRSRLVARWLVRHPLVAALALLGVLAACVPQLPGLKIQRGLDPFFDRTLPEQRFNDAVVAKFANDELLFLAYESKDAFSFESLSAIRALSAEIEALQVLSGEQRIPMVEEVRSLTTVKDVVGTELSFKTEPLVPDPIPSDAGALARIKARAWNHPILRDTLLPTDRDPRIAAAVVRISPALDDDQTARLIEQVRGLAQARIGQGLERFYIAGHPVVGTEMAAHQGRDTKRLIPLVALVMGLVLLVMIRRLAGIALAYLNMALALVVGLATLRVLAHTMNNITGILPVLAMVMAVGMTVHFLVGLAEQAAEGAGAGGGGEETLAALLPPAFMCALTTAVGFASLMVAQIPAIRDFGVAAAITMMACFVISFLTAALAIRCRPAAFWVSPRSLILSDSFRGLVERCFQVSRRWPLPILAVFVVLTVITGVGASRIYGENNNLEYFREDSPLRLANDYAEAHFGGLRPIVVSLKADRPDRFLEPEALRKVEALQAFMRQQLGAEHLLSYVDFVKVMHRGFFAEAPEHHRIPDTAEQVSQLLLLNGDPALDQFVDAQRQWLRVTARTAEDRSPVLEQIYLRLDEYLAREFPAEGGITAVATGETKLSVRAVQSIIRGQIDSMGASFLLVFIPLFIFFRSLQAGALTIPSNLVPVCLVLGTMGWLNVPLNVGTAMCAPIALGILVDDTVHFIHYCRGRFFEHEDLDRAVLETLRHKGTTVVTSTLTFGLGFAVMLFATYKAVVWFGALILGALVVGLVAEVLLLPALILATRTRFGLPPSAAPGAPVLPSTPGVIR